MERDQLKLLAAGAVIGLAAGFLLARALYVKAGNATPAGGPMVTGPAAPGAQPSADGPMGTMNPQQQELHQQIQLLLERVQANPQDRDARVAIGNITMDNGLNDMAAKFYEEALALDGNDPFVTTDLGIVYRNLNQSTKAVETFERAVAMKPDHVKGWYNIAVVSFYDLKDSDKARTAIAKVLELDPSFPGALELQKQLGSS